MFLGTASGSNRNVNRCARNPGTSACRIMILAIWSGSGKSAFVRFPGSIQSNRPRPQYGVRFMVMAGTDILAESVTALGRPNNLGGCPEKLGARDFLVGSGRRWNAPRFKSH